MIDTWIDAEQVEADQVRKLRQARKMAALDDSTAQWLSEFERANHFRQQWMKATGAA